MCLSVWLSACLCLCLYVLLVHLGPFHLRIVIFLLVSWNSGWLSLPPPLQWLKTRVSPLYSIIMATWASLPCFWPKEESSLSLMLNCRFFTYSFLLCCGCFLLFPDFQVFLSFKSTAFCQKLFCIMEMIIEMTKSFLHSFLFPFSFFLPFLFIYLVLHRVKAMCSFFLDAEPSLHYRYEFPLFWYTVLLLCSSVLPPGIFLRFLHQYSAAVWFSCCTMTWF